MHACIHTYIHVYIYICSHMNTCMYTCTYVVALLTSVHLILKALANRLPFCQLQRSIAAKSSRLRSSEGRRRPALRARSPTES